MIYVRGYQSTLGIFSTLEGCHEYVGFFFSPVSVKYRRAAFGQVCYTRMLTWAGLLLKHWHA